MLITKNIVKEFQNFLNNESVLITNEEKKPFECDGLTAYPQMPGLVLLPENEEETIKIIKICEKHKIPIVFRGAGTGLSGGAIPHKSGVLLVMSKLNKIVEIDSNNRIAKVQPGVRNISISESASKFGLYYAPDPSSQIACSIGGNIAENSGGVHCLKYGLTVNNILSLRIILTSGEIVTLGNNSFDANGYDLLSFFIGSEGMLGVVTEITVKLLPKPEKTQVVLAAFNSLKDAGEAVGNVIGSGIVPAGLEMMDKKITVAVEDFVKAGYPVEAEAILLCESDGTSEEVNDEINQISSVMKESGAYEIRISKNDEERNKFWLGRKSAFPAVGRILPDYFCMDGTIPKKSLSYVLEEIEKLSEKYSLQCANVFHAGDGNLHPLIMFDASDDAQLKSAEKFGADILKLCIAVGGTITGEHGVGIEKINEMCHQFSKSELNTFHSLKEVFDPSAILNPDKAIPTLNRCAEFGHMHVHKNQDKFPNIPRF